MNFFGARDGLVHMSQISNRRTNKVSEVLKEGQRRFVKVMGFDDRGKVRLVMKGIDQDDRQGSRIDRGAWIRGRTRRAGRCRYSGRRNELGEICSPCPSPHGRGNARISAADSSGVPSPWGEDGASGRVGFTTTLPLADRFPRPICGVDVTKAAPMRQIAVPALGSRYGRHHLPAIRF